MLSTKCLLDLSVKTLYFKTYEVINATRKSITAAYSEIEYKISIALLVLFKI